MNCKSFLYCLIAYACFCLGSMLAQGMPGMPGMPMPPGNGMGGMGFNPNFNPFTGPIQSRGINLNNRNNNDNANNRNTNNTANQDKNARKPPVEQSRSNTDNMLDTMGLHGIQDFYSALTSELARNPSGFQGNSGNEAMGYRKK